LADFLDIESLQKLALQKFNRLIHNSFPPKGYVEAAQEALANIGPTDIALKKAILQQCLVDPTEIAKSESLIMILKESEPLAWTMSQDPNKRYLDQVSISGQLKRDLEATAVELANAKKNGAGLVEDARSKLAKFQTLVNRTLRCANRICTQRFRAEGGSTNYRDTPALRCKACGHWY
jgi:hypothetical protein